MMSAAEAYFRYRWHRSLPECSRWCSDAWIQDARWSSCDWSRWEARACSYLSYLWPCIHQRMCPYADWSSCSFPCPSSSRCLEWIETAHLKLGSGFWIQTQWIAAWSHLILPGCSLDIPSTLALENLWGSMIWHRTFWFRIQTDLLPLAGRARYY